MTGNAMKAACETLKALGYTYHEGAERWKPPMGDKQIQALQNLSVTNILLDVVPGHDGMGHEIYATSVNDVVDRFTTMAEELEDWRLGIRRFIKESP